MTWVAVLAGAAGCYAAKLAGLSVPERVLRDPLVQRIATMLPVALLGALAATQTLTTGRDVVVDERAAAIIVAIGAVLLRLPFIAVIALAVGAAAGLRLVA